VMQYFPSADRINFDDSNETILEDTAAYSFSNVSHSSMTTYLGNLPQGFGPSANNSSYYYGGAALDATSAAHKVPSILNGDTANWSAAVSDTPNASGDADAVAYSYTNGDSSNPNSYHKDLSFSGVFGDSTALPQSDEYTMLTFTRTYQTSDDLNNEFFGYEKILAQDSAFTCASPDEFSNNPTAPNPGTASASAWECQSPAVGSEATGKKIDAVQYKVNQDGTSTFREWAENPASSSAGQ
jgi:hypothetical protein